MSNLSVRREFINALWRRIEPFSRPAWAAASEQYWINGDDDSDGTYCDKCAEVEYGFEARDGTFIDGGFSLESDGCVHCDRCGRLLEYSLTDAGAVYEINHYSENCVRVLTAEEAAHIETALGACVDEPAVQQRAILVGLAAVAAIPLLPPPGSQGWFNFPCSRGRQHGRSRLPLRR